MVPTPAVSGPSEPPGDNGARRAQYRDHFYRATKTRAASGESGKGRRMEISYTDTLLSH
jgi:hypothetical protein